MMMMMMIIIIIIITVIIQAHSKCGTEPHLRTEQATWQDNRISHSCESKVGVLPYPPPPLPNMPQYTDVKLPTTKFCYNEVCVSCEMVENDRPALYSSVNGHHGHAHGQ